MAYRSDIEKIVAETNGVYVMHSEKGPSIKIRELVDYCKQENKSAEELTQEEIDRFYR